MSTKKVVEGSSVSSKFIKSVHERMKTILSRFFVGLIFCLISCDNTLNSNSNTKDSTSPVHKTIKEYNTSKISDTGTQINKEIIQPPFVHDSNKQYIYLTFDDGPQHGTTGCMQVCRELAVKATFFMIGAHVIGRQDGRSIINQIKESYPQFLLANHSFSHASGKYNYYYSHPNMSFADFLKTQDTLAAPFKIGRLPGNNAWVLSDTMRASKLVKPVCLKLDSAGYHIFGWDSEWMFDHLDARPVQSAEKMAKQITYLLEDNALFTKNHLVLLTHDRMFQRAADLDSLKKMISILKENPKYVFETIDHYPGN